MNLVILLAVFLTGSFGFVVQNDQKQLSGQELVDYVNSVQKLFVAEENGMTEEEMRSKVMDVSFKNIPANFSVEVKSDIHPEIPDSFDVRNRWGACKTTKIIRDQRSCGSCWAFSSAEVISDRICIKTNGRSQPEISAEDVLTCVKTEGCSGGWPLYAFIYWSKNGLVTGGDYGEGGCKPYSIGPCTQAPCTSPIAPACAASCKTGYPVAFVNDKHYGLSSYAVAKQPSVIQTEIMTNGPVVAVYSVYSDFYKYKSGIYKHTAGSLMGLHAVKILGWGTENGTPYWIVANSWGKTWGEAGFFRIYRGINDCGIEESIVAGLSKET